MLAVIHIRAYSRIINMQRTCVTLPKDLIKWARKIAKENGQTLSSFLRVTLEGLKRDGDPKH
jgi:hypothetical protein